MHSTRIMRHETPGVFCIDDFFFFQGRDWSGTGATEPEGWYYSSHAYEGAMIYSPPYRTEREAWHAADLETQERLRLKGGCIVPRWPPGRCACVGPCWYRRTHP